MSLEAKLQSATANYQKLQSELQKLVNSRQLLDAQSAENTGVKASLEGMKPADKCEVFKLVGPVLLKQDEGEARANVERRLGFLKDEIKRVEEKIASTQTTLETSKLEIVHIQSQLQQQAPAAPGAIKAAS